MEEQMDILVHSGVAHDENPPGRGSGRWPWGSGDKPFQRPKDFLQQVKRLEAMGKSDKEIEKAGESVEKPDVNPLNDRDLEKYLFKNIDINERMNKTDEQ